MFATLLAKLLSPSGLLYTGVALLTLVTIHSAIGMVDDYATVKQNNTILQADVDTATKALAAEKQAAATQHQIDQATIDAIHQLNTEQATAFAQAQTDANTLLQMRPPTDADVKCNQSPYVATAYDQMRKQRRAGAPATVGSAASDAGHPH